MANNNYPQITSVTSESLQSQLRTLLPSQEGFGTDLMAQNVIVPIIDLTSAAEGSTIGVNLQTALAFGSQTAFNATNATVVIANTAGFYRIFGNANIATASAATRTNSFTMSDGFSSKTIWKQTALSNISSYIAENFDFVVFLKAGDSISAVSDSSGAIIQGSSRQIADVNGTLVQPSGFSPQ